LIQDGAVVGLNGCGGADEAKTAVLALTEHAKEHALKNRWRQVQA